MKLNCWMKNIDDGKEVLTLNIPGTHDCVTRYVQFEHISKCQSKSIYGQLELGIRALDIRVQSSKSRLKMVHGFAKAFNSPKRFSPQMDMEDVLLQCYKFLDEHKSEAIIFQFKNDNGKENEKCFDNLFNTYIKANEDKWFLENRSPLMKEARGKIILIRRCKMADKKEYTDKNTGIDFSKWVEQDTKKPYPLTLETGGESGMTFVIQDRFKYKPEERWSDVIKPFLDTMAPFDGRYIINYLSTAGGFKGPYNNSKYINPKFMEYPLNDNYYYGTVYTDFPDEALVRKIIKTNK
ncbi:MAG: phosphatidylinositol-specific phospholipase C domain-containing protein [Eubacterium sp.]